MQFCVKSPRKHSPEIHRPTPSSVFFRRTSHSRTGLGFNIRIRAGLLSAGFESMEKSGLVACFRQTIAFPFFLRTCSTHSDARIRTCRFNGQDAAFSRDDCYATPWFWKVETQLQVKLSGKVG